VSAPGRASIAALAVVAQGLLAVSATAADFFVYPVKVAATVRMVVEDFSMEFDSIAQVKLKEKDIVNLALGRPLGSKVDKKTEVLALATPFEGSSMSPLTKLIVFDPSASGPARIVETVAEATALEVEAATGNGSVTGQGTAIAEIEAVGDAGDNALNASTVLLTAAGKTSPSAPPGPEGKIAWKGALAGRMSVTTQAATISGFIVTGKIAASGKSIGQFTE
jgi:hypothetical protein